MPILLATTLPVTNLNWQMSVPGARLSNLALVPLSAEVTSLSLVSLDADTYTVSLGMDPTRRTASLRPLASLGFLASSNDHSATAVIGMAHLQALQANGLVITNAATAAGRVRIVGQEPILDLTFGWNPDLTLYGRPGTGYTIQSSTNGLTDIQWRLLTNFLLLNRSQTFALTNSAEPFRFFRATRP